MFNVILDWRRSFVRVPQRADRGVGRYIPDIVCIAQTTLVMANNALLVNDRWFLFFRFDLVSDLTACIYGANIWIRILRPSSPNRTKLADLWSLNGNTILILLWNFLFGEIYSVCLSVVKLASAEYATNAFSSKSEIRKISRFGWRSPNNAEFGHFTLLFCRGRERNVPRILTHVHSYCSALQTYCLVTFSLPLPLPSWFA